MNPNPNQPYDYTFKHSFTWPPSITPSSASAAPHPAPEVIPHAHGYSPRMSGYWPRVHYAHEYRGHHWWRRGFGMRRLVWFGLGVWGTAVWYRHRENHDREGGHAGWGRGWHRGSQDRALQNTTTPTGNNQSQATQDQVVPTGSNKQHWYNRRSMDQPSTTTPIPDKTDELSAMKDTFKEAWEKSRSEGVILRDNANKKAKEYAKEKLDKLVVALESLRESLDRDEDKKEGKMV